jgi:myosin-5
MSGSGGAGGGGGRGKSRDASFIGILDIYGFESFETNGFPQFCINYANEKLQQHFNQHIFKFEQKEYIKEKIDWSYINFSDNQGCIDLLENKPMCLLSLLDEECRFPNGSDASFATKVRKTHKDDDFFAVPRFSQTGFTVKHYAGMHARHAHSPHVN